MTKPSSVANRIPVAAPANAVVEGEGALEIDEAALARADAAVAALAGDYLKLIGDDIGALRGLVGELQADAGATGPALERTIDIAHNIKGQAGSFGYTLLGAVAGSLTEYARTLSVVDRAAIDLIRIHVEAMTAVVEQDLVGDGGEAGTRLLALLARAIERCGGT